MREHGPIKGHRLANWNLIEDEDQRLGWMTVYNYGRAFSNPADVDLAKAMLAGIDYPVEGRLELELEPTQKLEVIEVEELSDECGVCHVVMSTRDGIDPTKVCDNCAQAFYARLTNPETLRRMSVEITEALINRIPDVHAIYAQYIQRETLKEINEVIEEK